jgi:hypothetical protein
MSRDPSVAGYLAQLTYRNLADSGAKTAYRILKLMRKLRRQYRPARIDYGLRLHILEISITRPLSLARVVPLEAKFDAE